MDDETENFLKRIVYEIKNILNYKEEINVYILDSQELNAAATQNGDVIVNVGALLQCKNVKEIIAILAHEVAHVEGRHVTTFLSNRRDFLKGGLITTLIGAMASVCAGSPAPLLAGVAGGGAVGNQMALAALRKRENMADTKAAEAIELLDWPVFEGFESIHRKLASDPGLYNAYLSTHPESQDRISKFKKYLAKERKKHFNKKTTTLIAEFEELFKKIQHKLRALILPVEEVMAFYAVPKNVNERNAKAVVLYRSGQYEKAIGMVNELLETSNDSESSAYYIEIKAMSLINTKKCEEAAVATLKALNNCKKVGIHRDLGIIYAYAVVEGRLLSHCEKAVKILKKVSVFHKDDLSVLSMLGKLYTMTNKRGKASLCAAEAAFLTGDLKGTIFHAEKARSSGDKLVTRKASDLILDAKETFNSNSGN